MATDTLKYAAEDRLATSWWTGVFGNETLTQTDIDEADAVIFAVSVNVRDRSRFADKPYVEAP